MKLVRTPLAASSLNSAAFGFEVSQGRNGSLCSDCSITCKLDNYASSDCKSREVFYEGLNEGAHTFEVCTNGSLGIQCARHNWTVDTVPPTAYVSAGTSFTSMSNVSVRITFNKPCTGGGGFRCSSDYCSLLVYGPGHVMPSTLKVLRPDLEFSLMVAISADVQYGRLVLVMDKNFCTDAGGNRFTRTTNSSFLLHFDRRNVSVQLRTHVPKKLLQLNGVLRTVEATNNHKNLKVYLYFSEPVVNSSGQILDILHTSSGVISPTNGDNLDNRRFGYMVSSLSNMAIVTVTCDTSFIVSRQGTPSSSSAPVTFLYDAQRPSVKLSTTSNKRTTKHKIPVLIKFVKPVFGFNSSAVSISGGHLLSFHEISRSIYSLEVHADDSSVSIVVPENITADVAGNKNLESNQLQLRHYCVPTTASLVSTITTVVFAATSMAAILLTVSTANLMSFELFSKPTAYLISEPSRNLWRIACHIQVFALTKWLAVSLPVEYYEFTRGLEWSIPYITLPWEDEGIGSFTKDSALPMVTYSQKWGIDILKPFRSSVGGYRNLDNSSVYGTPLTPMEYRLFLEDQNMMPEAKLIMGPHDANGWRFFGRNMFWLAVIGGGLMVVHAVLLLILRLRRKKSEGHQEFGALAFPRLEILLLLLALPCVCQAAATVIRGSGTAGTAVGIILFGICAFLLLSVFLFLSIGITFGKLLHYKEVHQEGEEPHWYQELVRVSLGPGKRGQWTWKDQPNSVNLTRFGPLFEDLRGPPKYMLSQFAGGPVSGDRIIASDDETEDAEATVIQKLFGILRIYYTILESAKRVTLGILAGIYSTGAQTSRTSTLIILSISAFQLFFLVLKKPFIKKRVQSVEIISLASELFIFAAALVLLDNDFSESSEKILAYIMLAVFAIGFAAQMINEWYSLYRQVVQLSLGDAKFISGLKTAAIGIILFILPSRLVAALGEKLGEGTTNGTGEKPWMRQLRELAKESFTKEEEWTVGAKDPSTSWNSSRKRTDPSTSRSGFWSGKRSGSSSVTASLDAKAKGDLKAKSRGLYKDLEAIFSSK